MRKCNKKNLQSHKKRIRENLIILVLNFQNLCNQKESSFMKIINRLKFKPHSQLINKIKFRTINNPNQRLKKSKIKLMRDIKIQILRMKKSFQMMKQMLKQKQRMSKNILMRISKKRKMRIKRVKKMQFLQIKNQKLNKKQVILKKAIKMQILKMKRILMIKLVLSQKKIQKKLKMILIIALRKWILRINRIRKI